LDRRTLLTSLALVPALPMLAQSGGTLGAVSQDTQDLIPPPDGGDLNVSFLLSDGAVVIDFCGPWEVFHSVAVGGPHTSPDHQMPFRLHTVAESREPIRASGGMRITPDYTLDDAPPAHVVVIPAQNGHSDRMLDWIRTSHESADVTLSVCTGAFLLASTGLLDGLAATTHHYSYDRFESEFPGIELRRGMRFVEQDRLVTAGGLSSGIDASLRIVERYYGRDVAQYTATYMAYEGTGWMI
jgi:transcriptional regulator GlxA family with amidase domain